MEIQTKKPPIIQYRSGGKNKELYGLLEAMGVEENNCLKIGEWTLIEQKKVMAKIRHFTNYHRMGFFRTRVYRPAKVRNEKEQILELEIYRVK